MRASGERWAVIAVDPSKRAGDGCEGIVQSFHHSEYRAQEACSDPTLLGQHSGSHGHNRRRAL